MKRFRSVLIGAVATFVSTCFVSVSAGYTYSDYLWSTFNGHQYAFTLVNNSWAGAEAEAEAIGYHLTTVNDTDENAWLTLTFDGLHAGNINDPSTSYVWIGAHQIVPGSPRTTPFDWADGEPFDYVGPLYPGWDGVWCPASGGGTEFGYLHTKSHTNPGTWANAGNDCRGIIETPEPSTFVLFGIGAISLLAYVLRRWKQAA
jgi:hypothetical protein